MRRRKSRRTLMRRRMKRLTIELKTDNERRIVRLFKWRCVKQDKPMREVLFDLIAKYNDKANGV